MAQNKSVAPGRAATYAFEAIRDGDELNELAKYAVDYAQTIGCVARHPEHRFDSWLAVPPPLALLPSPFPREIYEQAMRVQTTLNELYFKVASDHDFLMEAYKDVVKGDPFNAQMVALAKRVHAEGVHQPLMVQLQRADYMSHQEQQGAKIELKQVEVNTGQIGGPGAATATSRLHAKMLDKVAIQHQGALPSVFANAVQPENRVRQRWGAMMHKAWKLFGDPDAVVLFISQPALFPVCGFEQIQFIMFELQKQARRAGDRVNVVRLSIPECVPRLRLDGDFSLRLDGCRRVALVHMGYGYQPEHYPTEAEWNTRVMMERSTAILSPNVRCHLSGTKKIQQLLAKPGVLERFFPAEPGRVAALRATFTELWGLEGDDPTTRAIIAKACAEPANFVMKNQMGAGHGNFFDEALSQKLGTMSLEERSAYILHKKIHSVVTKNYFMRQFDTPKEERVISEIGVYGSLIGNQANGQILHNDVDGHLCRSKTAESNEGGVSVGSGVIDSALLFPASEFQ